MKGIDPASTQRGPLTEFYEGTHRPCELVLRDLDDVSVDIGEEIAGSISVVGKKGGADEDG